MRPRKRGLAPHLCVNVNVFGGGKKLHAGLLDWDSLKIGHGLSSLTIMIIIITSIDYGHTVWPFLYTY